MIETTVVRLNRIVELDRKRIKFERDPSARTSMKKMRPRFQFSSERNKTRIIYYLYKIFPATTFPRTFSFIKLGGSEADHCTKLRVLAKIRFINEGR